MSICNSSIAAVQARFSLGSIYEGLLEYKLRVADQDLYTVKEKGREVFVPLADIQKQKKGVDDSKIVHKGDLYLVTDKGERKATGSYFTSDYIVKYIVENTLGPIVEEKKALKNGNSPIKTCSICAPDVQII